KALAVGEDNQTQTTYLYLTGTSQDASGNSKVLIAKVTDDPMTQQLAEGFHDTVGGSGTSDEGNALAIDPVSGNAVVVGTTNSAAFPVPDGSTLSPTATSDACLLTYSLS